LFATNALLRILIAPEHDSEAPVMFGGEQQFYSTGSAHRPFRSDGATKDHKDHVPSHADFIIKLQAIRETAQGFAHSANTRLKFTIIGHSLGGLYSRNAIGYLYEAVWWWWWWWSHV
jgi:hypothetical protein